MAACVLIVPAVGASGAQAAAGLTPRQEIAALKKQVRTLQAQVKELRSDVKFLNGRVSALQEEASVIPQLAEIAVATARDRNVENALADGYVHSGVACIPQAGIHYGKGRGWPDDDVLDPLQPEFLMYATSAGGLKLVAVEYAVPARFPRPSLLGRTFEKYDGGLGGEQVWGLHVWLWQLNPAGLFSALNRTVEC